MLHREKVAFQVRFCCCSSSDSFCVFSHHCPCKLFCKICVRLIETNVKKIPLVEFWKIIYGWMLYFDLRPGPKILFQGNTPEGSDTFQRPVIERDRVDGLRLMIWDKVKVPLCHYSHAPEESNLWTAWQLFPLDDD